MSGQLGQCRIQKIRIRFVARVPPGAARARNKGTASMSASLSPWKKPPISWCRPLEDIPHVLPAREDIVAEIQKRGRLFHERVRLMLDREDADANRALPPTLA